MAVTFTSYDSGQKFLIGGQSVTTGTDDGNIGTMPTFSISRNETLLGDGTYIGSTFDITITGTARTVGNLDISNKGASQTAIQNLAVKDLQFNKASKMFGNGKLEIAPYGGMPNTISFNDARLISVSIPEQDENSSGTQYLPYTFNFQANVDSSVSNNSDWGLSISQPVFKLKSASETWDLSESGEFSYDGGAISSEANKYKTYTLTHTISAQGIRKYTGTSIDSQDGHAWRQAAGWVKSRLDAASNPGTVISEDLMGNTQEIQAKFNALYMNENNATAIKNLNTDGYVAKNKTRTINSDIANGSYSITDNWLVTKGNINATHTVEVNIDNAVESDQITVSVNGTVNGLSTLDVDDQTVDKYTNALTEYNRLFGSSPSSLNDTQMGIVATDAYGDFNAIGYKTNSGLTARSISETHDKVNGVISWNVSFSDQYIGYAGATSQKVTYSYTNDHYLRYNTVKPSVIDVVSNGPLIYTPGTTDEKTMTVTVDLNMDRKNRASIPNGISLVDTSTAVHQYFAPRETSRSESWNPTTGVYNLSVTYTYA